MQKPNVLLLTHFSDPEAAKGSLANMQHLVEHAGGDYDVQYANPTSEAIPAPLPFTDHNAPELMAARQRRADQLQTATVWLIDNRLSEERVRRDAELARTLGKTAILVTRGAKDAAKAGERYAATFPDLQVIAHKRLASLLQTIVAKLLESSPAPDVTGS